MQGSTAMKSLKSMLPTLHHPLPPTKRQTQQLLDTLTASFRRSLEREHGVSDGRGAASALTTTQPQHRTGAISTAESNAKCRNTDTHIRTILSNPLFAYQPMQARPRAARHPMDVFDEAVAKGMMDLQKAAGCLRATQKQREEVSAASETPQDALLPSLRVVRWLQASGMESDMRFLTSHKFTSILVQILMADGQSAIIWSWLQSLLQRRSDATEPLATTYSLMMRRLILCMALAKTKGSETLDPVYECLLEAKTFLDELSMPDSAESTVAAWHWASWASTMHTGHRTVPNEELYDSFVAISNGFSRPHLELEHAHLAMHHPTHPESATAVEMLSTEKLWDDYLAFTRSQASQRQSPLPKGSRSSDDGSLTAGTAERFTRKIFTVGVDAVRSLVADGRLKDAQDLLQIIKTRLGIEAPGGWTKVAAAGLAHGR